MTLIIHQHGGPGGLLFRLEAQVSNFIDILDGMGKRITKSMESTATKKRDLTREIEVYGRALTSMLAEARAFLALQAKSPLAVDDAASAAELQALVMDALASLTIDKLNNLLRARGLRAVPDIDP